MRVDCFCHKPMMASLTLLLLAIFLPTRVNATLVINEFMADNGATVADPQGHYDDWIEIYNAGPGTVDLGGMYLTDDLLNPTQWQFPSGTFLGQGSYLLVWADEDALQTNGLHANFKLSAGGEDIGLVSTNGVTLIDNITFGAQTEDVSYGRFPNGDGTWYFMDQPSPNAANTTARSELMYFSRLGGVMTNSFTLKLSTPSDTGQIRYTTDGSIPNAASTLYNDGSGISINNSSSRRIRARAFQSGLAPGPVRTEAYLAVSSALETFNSNLPIIVIDTFGQTMPSAWYDGGSGTVIHADPIATYATLIDTNNVTGRAAATDQPDFAGRAGMNIRGQSTAELDKKPYKLETWDEDDQDRKVSLLGFPSDSDWVLHNPHTDKTFMRNVMAYRIGNDMGHYSSRTKFVEVFMNEGGGQIGGPASSDYLGVYVLMEKIKRGKARVDIEELRPTDNTEPEVTGGYVIRHDKNRQEDEFWTWAGRWFYVEPSDVEITTPQKTYIKNYIEEFESVLQGSGFDDPVNGYAKYIDVESFIDHDFCSEISKEVDSYVFSTYVTKDRGGKLEMSPEWDYNWSMGNNDYTGFGAPTVHHTTGWHRDGWGASEYRWQSRLMEDDEYLLDYADRWFHLRETVLSDAAIAQIMDTHYTLLNAEAAGRNFSRWDILNSFVGFYWVDPPVPNFYYGGSPAIPCYSADHTYGMQVEWMKNWLTGTGTPSGSCAAEAYAPQYSDRLGWIDDHMDDRTGATPPPAFFINGTPADTGATISVSDALTMSGGSGTVYYTLDGTDPREPFTGNAVGTAYSSGAPTIILDAGAPCTARIPTSAGDAVGWKENGYNDAGWLTGTTGVGFEASPGTYDYTSLIGLDVSGMQGVNSTVYIRVPFTLTGSTNVDALKLKMKYDDAFVAYINGTQVLSSAYAPATLSWNSSATNWNDDANAVVFEEYDITASIGALQEGDNLLAIHGLNASSGSSDLLFIPRLEATFSSSSGITLNKTVDVRARIKSGSTWSAMNEAVFADDRSLQDLRITEIMYHPQTPGEEYIELKNIGPDPINLYLCQFTDGLRFTFPDMTLAAGQYVLVVENQAAFEARYGTGLNIAGEFDAGSALSNGGEEIVLRDAAGNEIHDFDYNDWYPATDGRGASLCIIDPANTNLTLWDEKSGWESSSAPGGNPGTVNPANVLTNGAVIISEILTHTDAPGGDMIELHNTTASPIDVGGWFLSDDLDDLKKYQIAPGTSIPGGGYVVFTQEANFGLTATDPGKSTGFGLSELGEAVFLSSGSGTNLGGGYSISEDFGAADKEVTFGRHAKSAASAAAGDAADFVSMSTATMGADNATPRIPGVVINEIMYNPSAHRDEVGEYIELFNHSSSTVLLYDPAYPSNTWKFTRGIDYTFPPGVSVPAGAHVLVVRTDPDIFRFIHGIPSSRPVYGPYAGALANDGEKLELSMPGDLEPGFVPYIRVDQVNFSDGSHPAGNDPWPSGADGTLGHSLHRTVAGDYGNDVANWHAAPPTPATPDLNVIELQQTGGNTYLLWAVDGVLQSAPEPTGPWTNVPGATSPHQIFPGSQPAEYFRVQETGGP